jgi:D-alanine-D-alanine ligase
MTSKQSRPTRPGVTGRPRVGVLMGGPSAEREVSLKTGAGVYAALTSLGYDCVALDWTPGSSLPGLIAGARVDAVWNALHGVLGEDGAVQGLLACMGLPATGSGVLASALGMDKIASKQRFEAYGVPTPPWRVLATGASPDDARAIAGELGWPLVVKPAHEGSSVGVTIVRRPEQLEAAVEEARAHTGPTLMETYIAGREVCVGLLDGDVLGDVEVVPAIEFYDYAAKYTRGDTDYRVPAPLPSDVRAHVHTAAVAAYAALGCSGHSRVDLRVDAHGTPYVLEVNTLPGMTGTSLLPKIAAHAGLDYAALCERILFSAR